MAGESVTHVTARHLDRIIIGVLALALGHFDRNRMKPGS